MLKVPRALRNQSQRVGALGIVLIYAALAALWILFSDRLLGWLFPEAALFSLLSTLKGWAFVLVSSIFLYAVLRRRSPAEESIGADSSRMIFVVLLIGVFLGTGLAIRGYWEGKREAESARLQAIADLKTRQVADWLQERRADIQIIAGNPVLAGFYHAGWTEGDAASRQSLADYLDYYRKIANFAGVVLLDDTGKSIWSVGEPCDSNIPSRSKLLAEIREMREVRLLGPYPVGEKGIHLDLIGMIDQENSQALLLFCLDPTAWLTETLQVGSSQNASGEVLLFRREGEDVLFLNELRHRSGTAARLRRPLSDTQLPAAQVLRGDAVPGHLIDGEDYRGVSVLGVIAQVPGTDWYLTVKIDRAEVYAAVLYPVTWIVLGGALVLFLGWVGLMLVRHREALRQSAGIQRAQAERLQALQLLDNLVEGSAEAICAKDLDGNYILFNRAAEKIVGKSAESVLGENEYAVFPAEQASRLIAAARRVIAEKSSIAAEEELDTTQGKRIFLATLGPLLDVAGNVTGTFCLAHDITERKLAEQALILGEQRFHDIVNASADWVWELDREGRYTYASEGVSGLLGYMPEEVIGKTPFDFMPPEEAEAIRRALDGFVARRAPFRDLVNVNRHRDGSLRHVSTNGTPIIDAEGHFLGYRGVDRDITALKLDELALRESEARFRALFENASVSICIYAADSGILVDANRRAIESYGYRSIEDLRGRSRWLPPPHAREDALAYIRQASEKKILRFEWKACDCDGGEFWEDVTLQAIRLDGCQRVMAMANDITARKAAEKVLRAQADELGRHNAELERFNRASVGREIDMIELKRQINLLSQELGRQPPYSQGLLHSTDTLNRGARS